MLELAKTTTEQLIELKMKQIRSELLQAQDRNEQNDIVLKESKSNITTELFAAVVFSIFSAISVICWQEIFFRDIQLLDGVDISKLYLYAIAPAIAIPLDLIVLLNLIVPQRFVINNEGICSRFLGYSRKMSWQDILEVKIVNSTVGGAEDPSQILLIVGKDAIIRVGSVFNITPLNLSTYLKQRISSTNIPIQVPAENIPDQYIKRTKKRINQKILIWIFLVVLFVVAVAIAIFFLWIVSVIRR